MFSIFFFFLVYVSSNVIFADITVNSYRNLFLFAIFVFDLIPWIIESTQS